MGHFGDIFYPSQKLECLMTGSVPAFKSFIVVLRTFRALCVSLASVLKAGPNHKIKKWHPQMSLLDIPELENSILSVTQLYTRSRKWAKEWDWKALHSTRRCIKGTGWSPCEPVLCQHHPHCSMFTQTSFKQIHPRPHMITISVWAFAILWAWR